MNSLQLLKLLLGTFVFLFLFTSTSVHSQILITSPQFEYGQDFNTLTAEPWVDNSTLPGWYVSPRQANVAESNGSDFAHGVKSYGSAANNDRALGLISTSENEAYRGVHFKNNSGVTISHFYVSYSAELWYHAKQESEITFGYKKQKANTRINLSDDFEEVKGLDAEPTTTGSARTIDGNAIKENKISVYFSVKLEPGEELLLRWEDSQASSINRIGIDDVHVRAEAVQSSAPTVYYLKKETGNGKTIDIGDPKNWVSNAEGTGKPLKDFSGANLHYIINRSDAVLDTDLNVMPSTSKFVLETYNTFLLPLGKTLNATIDVNAFATLTIENSTLPQFGQISPYSTIVYGEAPEFISTQNYGNLQIKEGTKKLNNNTNIKGSLELRNGGKLDLGEFDLTMEGHKKFAAFDPSSYIRMDGKGKVKIKLKAGENATIPVGTASGYTPVNLKLNSGPENEYSVRVIDQVYTSYVNDAPQGVLIDQQVVGKTWLIDETVKGGSNLDVTLFWSPADTLRGFNPNTVFIAHYENGVWDQVAGQKAELVNGMYSLTRTGITSFSPFAVMSAKAGPVTPLPVELLYFNATKKHGRVTFDWATASESDHDFFQVEQSADGRTFKAVGESVSGAGNSTTVQTYQTSAPVRTSQTTYFRLKQVDLDGTIALSKIVSVSFKENLAAVALQAYPNPTANVLYLRAPYLTEGEATVTLRQANGSVLFKKQIPVQAGTSNAIDLSAQPAGMYLLHVQYANHQSVLRVMRQ